MQQIVKAKISCIEENASLMAYWMLIEKQHLQKLIISLTLLNFQMIERVLITNGTTYEFIIEKDELISKKIANRRGTLSLIGNKKKVSLSSGELQYWLEFFLRYFRDGFSAEMHMDFILSHAQVDGRNIDFQLGIEIDG